MLNKRAICNGNIRKRFLIFILALGAIVRGYFMIISENKGYRSAQFMSMESRPRLPAVMLSGQSHILHETGSSAQQEVVPKSVIAQVGTVARFNCTATNEEPVYWYTKPYGSEQEHEIYIGEKLLVEEYGRSGRFSVEVDSTVRRYDLVIKDIKQSDGGVYICIHERGVGKKAYAELVAWDALTCQVDHRQESYMGENFFGLDHDAISCTCKMNYKGNIRPWLVWSIGGGKMHTTQGTESGIASSSLILYAKSKLNGVNVTCEAVIRGNSSEVTRTGILWTSGTIRVNYAMLKKQVVKECPGVENILDCNPPCSYKLETVNGTQRCAVSYATGTEVKSLHFDQSSAHSSVTDSRYWIAMTVLAAVLACFVLITLALALGYFIKKQRFRRTLKNKNVGNALLKRNINHLTADKGV